MKFIPKIIDSSPLLRGSFIIFTSSMVANVGSYLFHLLAGRWLGPANYGIFESLISIIYFLSIPGGVFSLLIVKLASEKKANPAQVSILIKTLLVQMGRWGAITLVLYLIAAIFLQKFLAIPSYWLLLGVGVIYYTGLVISPIPAILQGLTKFTTLGFLTIIGSWFKLLIAFPLLFVGFKLGGIIFSMVIGGLLVSAIFLLTISKLYNFWHSPTYQVTRNTIVKNSRFLLASLLLSLSVTAFYTTDILMARKFLPPVEAGYYSALSILGKIIFFASSAVTSVMFPFVVEKHNKGEDGRKTLLLSLVIVLFVSFAATIAYALYPELMITTLFGSSYLPAIPYLVPFALFICIYAVDALLLNYYMGVARIKMIYFTSLFALLQLVGLLIKHDTITDILTVNIGVLLFLALILLVSLTIPPKPRVDSV